MTLCREIEPLLLDRAAGAVDPGDGQKLEVHLAVCAACRAEAALLDAALAAARIPPPGVAERRALSRAEAATLRAWRGAERTRRHRSLLKGFAAGLAVAGAAAVVAFTIFGVATEPPGRGGSVPAVPGPVAAAGWQEPDLDALWEASAFALVEDPGDEAGEPIYAEVASGFTHDPWEDVRRNRREP